MKEYYPFFARAVGRPAWFCLQSAGQGVVIGLSSRGAFLRLAPCGPEEAGQPRPRIVFLSGERFHGPLTVNVEPAALERLSLTQGDTFTVQDAALVFDRSGVQLAMDNAPAWSAPPRPEAILPAQARRTRFQRVSQRICAERDLPDFDAGPLSGASDSDLASRRLARRTAGLRLLAAGEHRPPLRQPTHQPDALSGGRGPQAKRADADVGCSEEADLHPSAISSPVTERHCDAAAGAAVSFAEAISSSTVEATALAARLVSCLGRGPGLTPAGDDLVLGFLLALARWGDVLCPTLSSAEIAAPLLDAARRTTTSLSVQLLECAAQGQADERLIAALDGLVFGKPEESEIAQNLQDWGHTSGAAALRGMGLVAAAVTLTSTPALTPTSIGGGTGSLLI